KRRRAREEMAEEDDRIAHVEPAVLGDVPRLLKPRRRHGIFPAGRAQTLGARLPGRGGAEIFARPERTHSRERMPFTRRLRVPRALVAEIDDRLVEEAEDPDSPSRVSQGPAVLARDADAVRPVASLERVEVVDDDRDLARL